MTAHHFATPGAIRKHRRAVTCETAKYAKASNIYNMSIYNNIYISLLSFADSQGTHSLPISVYFLTSPFCSQECVRNCELASNPYRPPRRSLRHTSVNVQRYLKEVIP